MASINIRETLSGVRPINSLAPVNTDVDVLDNGEQKWLRTGVVESDPSVYPNAFVEEGILPTGERTRLRKVAGGVTDITWDGTHLWSVNYNSSTAHQHDLNGYYTGVSFNTLPQPYGIAWDGTHFWVVGRNSSDVHQYDPSGNYTGVNFNVDTVVPTPQCMTWDGTHLWIAGSGTLNCHKFTTAGAYTGDNFPVNKSLGGLCWDGTHFWGVGFNALKSAYQFDPATGETGVTFPLESPATINSTGMEFINNAYYVADINLDAAIEYKYQTLVGSRKAYRHSITGSPYYVRVE